MGTKLKIASEAPNAEGLILEITPETAGWEFVGFQVYGLKPGQVLRKETGSDEACVVLLEGKARFSTPEEQWESIGERMSVFDGTPPFSVFIPSGSSYEVEALTELKIAVCLAPGKPGYAPRLIRPEQVGIELRGSGNTKRYIHNILPESEPAASLLVVEVLTPNGHWSSYPPHKHDQNRLPEESALEETYFHLVNPAHGFALQRVYTDDRSLDETLVVRNGEAVLVPKGYHPVSAPPGYDLYYLNVMAGPVRTWKFKNDPDHEWIMKQK